MEPQGRNRGQDRMADGSTELVGLGKTVANQLEDEREGSVEDKAEHERESHVKRQVFRDGRTRRRVHRNDVLAL